MPPLCGEAGVALPGGLTRDADETADGVPGHPGLAGRSDGFDDVSLGGRALRNRMPQWGLARGRRATPSSLVAGAAVLGASGSLLAGSVTAFRRHRTTVDPVAVDRAERLAVGGPNRITRNPMCVGLGGMPLAHAIARRSLPALIPALGFYWFIDRYQIPVEEAALEAGFGKAYRDYWGTVPRRLGSRGVIPMSRSLMRGGLVTELVEGVECFATARRRIGPAHYCRPRSRCRPLAGPVCEWIRPQWP